MGWVLCSLRTMEDKVLHNNYQLELLKISRQRQQLARHKMLESTKLNTGRRLEISELSKSIKDAPKNDYDEALSAYLEAGKEEGADTTSQKEALDAARKAYEEAINEYNEQKETINNDYDEDLETLEQETTDEENALDLEQTEIETILEAITQEIQVTKQAISTDIQASNIKL